MFLEIQILLFLEKLPPCVFNILNVTSDVKSEIITVITFLLWFINIDRLFLYTLYSSYKALLLHLIHFSKSLFLWIEFCILCDIHSFCWNFLWFLLSFRGGAWELTILSVKIVVNVTLFWFYWRTWFQLTLLKLFHFNSTNFF